MDKQRKAVTVLGSTGSIGVSTLDVLSRHPEKFTVFALTANRNVERMVAQCQQFTPRYAVMSDETAAQQLADVLQAKALETEVLSGEEGLVQVAEHVDTDYVMAAIVGAAGLVPSLAAAKAGKRVMLANKEALVMSGALFMEAVRENNAALLPIDSEHNAIFQCLPAAHGQPHQQGVEKILLTASGGPFRTWTADTMQAVTPEQAVAHPNWSMGQKISVDSATLMNKGLEVIEACWLFGVNTDQIDVVVHPQSTTHSMVAYNDGSVLAELGNPDRRTPIADALAWPERMASGVEPLDLFAAARFDFERPDLVRFPCLRLAYEAHQNGGYATIALNAANEVAVSAFLQGSIRFMEIPALIEHVMGLADSGTPDCLKSILVQDQLSREAATSWVKNKKVH